MTQISSVRPSFRRSGKLGFEDRGNGQPTRFNAAEVGFMRVARRGNERFESVALDKSFASCLRFGSLCYAAKLHIGAPVPLSFPRVKPEAKVRHV